MPDEGLLKSKHCTILLFINVCTVWYYKKEESSLHISYRHNTWVRKSGPITHVIVIQKNPCSLLIATALTRGCCWVSCRTYCFSGQEHIILCAPAQVYTSITHTKQLLCHWASSFKQHLACLVVDFWGFLSHIPGVTCTVNPHPG